jgi:hypothetical protein
MVHSGVGAGVAADYRSEGHRDARHQCVQAEQAPPGSVSDIVHRALSGQLLTAASGQVPMTANNPASIKPGYLQDAPRGHMVYLRVY